jgi:hypothetical protein
MNVVAFNIERQPEMKTAELLKEVQHQYTRFINHAVAYTAQWIPSAAEENAGRGTIEIHLDDFEEHYSEQIKSLPYLSAGMVRKFSVEMHFRIEQHELAVECLYDQQYFRETSMHRSISRLEQILIALGNNASLPVAQLIRDISSKEKEAVHASQLSGIKAFFKKS